MTLFNGNLHPQLLGLLRLMWDDVRLHLQRFARSKEKL